MQSEYSCAIYLGMREMKEETKIRLRCLFFRGSELRCDKQYIKGVSRLLEEMRLHEVISVDLEELMRGAGESEAAAAPKISDLCRLMEAVLEEFGIGEAESMAIAAAPSMIGAADAMGLAVAVYENPDAGIKITDHPTVLLGFEDIDFMYMLRIWQRKHKIPWKILETERCYLREITLKDMDDLFELYAYKGMTDYIEPLYERKKEEDYQRAYIENMYGFYGYGMWLVKEKMTDKLIGRAGLENRLLGGEYELEMGYAIATPYQRQGYAAEVCEGVLRYVKETLGYTRVNCLIQKDNAPSIALIKKLGFSYLESVTEGGKLYERYIKTS